MLVSRALGVYRNAFSGLHRDLQLGGVLPKVEDVHQEAAFRLLIHLPHFTHFPPSTGSIFTFQNSFPFCFSTYLTFLVPISIENIWAWGRFFVLDFPCPLVRGFQQFDDLQAQNINKERFGFDKCSSIGGRSSFYTGLFADYRANKNHTALFRCWIYFSDIASPYCCRNWGNSCSPKRIDTRLLLAVAIKFSILWI